MLESTKGGYRGLLNEVWLAEEDVSEAHMYPRCHIEAYQEVVARGAWFPMRLEDLECLVGGLHQTRGAEF